MFLACGKHRLSFELLTGREHVVKVPGLLLDTIQTDCIGEVIDAEVCYELCRVEKAKDCQSKYIGGDSLRDTYLRTPLCNLIEGVLDNAHNGRIC
jgi:hypothetical protein